MKSGPVSETPGNWRPSTAAAHRPAKYEPVQAGKWLLGKYKDTHKDYKVPGEAL